MNIFKVDNETKDRRSRRRQHYLLSKEKFVIENYYSSDYDKESNIDLITVSFNNPIIIDYQIKLFRKYLQGSFCHIVCDNSNMEERAKQIREVCVKNNITYIHCEPKKIPHGYADSHGIALNWIYYSIVRKRKNNFAFLDHNIFPIKPLNIESYLEKAELAGRVYEQSGIWYLWPGFSFFRYNVLKNIRVNFRRHRKWYIFKVPIVDTGSGNWYSLYSKYNKELVNNIYFNGWNVADNKPLEANEAQGKFIQEKMVEYSMDNKWFHSICGAEWRDVKGKNKIVYKMLDDFLNNN